MFYVLFGTSFVLLISLVATAIYLVLQKKQKLDQETEQKATIHTSGMFSLVRQSPRKYLTDRALSKEQVIGYLKKAPGGPLPESEADKYLSHWERCLEENIQTIEKGDETGVQTYRYEIPSADQEICSYLSGSTYVTREQLQNYPNIIPPFYLGCGVKIVPKQAWNTNLNGTGWKPLLPVNGQYITPERSLVVKI